MAMCRRLFYQMARKLKFNNERGLDMIMFQTRSFWYIMKIPRRKIKNRFKYFFGESNKTIEDRQEALNVLKNITSTIQKEMIERFQSESTYGMLLKLYFIFDEVHSSLFNRKRN